MSEVREPGLFMSLWRTPLRDLIRLRLSCRLDWRREIAKSVISETSKALLLKLVRKTRLWRLEKAGIARELVAHFEDAITAGQSDEEAIALFGDWRKTAKLIRRATKRKRSYFWHAWRYSFWSVVALIGLYAAMGLYYLTGSRNIAVDYVAVLNQEAAAVSEDERAWPVLRDALLAMGYHNQAGYVQGDETNVYQQIASQTRPGDENWPIVQAFLVEHEPSIAELRRAAEMPGLGFVAGFVSSAEDLPLFNPDMTLEQHRQEIERIEQEYADEPPMVWMVLLQHLGSLQDMGRVLAVDAFRAAEAGEVETAYENLIAILDIADHADEHNSLINQFVAIAIRKTVFVSFSELLATHPDLFLPEQFAGLAKRVVSQRAWNLDLTGERHFMDDLLQHLFTDDGNGNGHLDARAWQRMAAELASFGGPAYFGIADESGLLPNVIGTAISPAATMIVANRKDMKTMADRMYTLLEADYAVPMWQQPESRSDAELIALAGDSHYLRARYFLIVVTMPAIGAARQTAERYAASTEGTLTAIALELYRRESGEYPESLDTLVPRYLPEVPIDRVTGDPLSYTLQDGRPVLYSFGADRDDDGGTIAYDADGHREQGVIKWVISEGETAVDGDWVVWPLHDAKTGE